MTRRGSEAPEPSSPPRSPLKGQGAGRRRRTRAQARAEAEAIRGTPQEVDGLVPVQATVKENADIVFSLRFTASEMAALRAAARLRGVTLSELVRAGALDAAAEAHGEASGRDVALQQARQFVEAAAQALERA